MVTNCSVCADHAKKQPSELLKHHHHFLGRRLELTFSSFAENITYSVCYRSRFIEVTKLEFLRRVVAIEELKRQFGVHGIPAEINGIG